MNELDYEEGVLAGMLLGHSNRLERALTRLEPRHFSGDRARLTAAIALAAPAGTYVVTVAPDLRFDQMSTAQIGSHLAQRLVHLTLILRERYVGGLELAAVPELAPKDGRPHLHVLTDRLIPLRTLRSLAAEAGLGLAPSGIDEFGRPKQVVRNRLKVAAYVMKGPLLVLDLEDDQAFRLLRFQQDLSAGRWMWITSGFWRDEFGNPTTLTEALVVAEALVPQVLERASKVTPAKCLPPHVLSHVLGESSSRRPRSSG